MSNFVRKITGTERIVISLKKSTIELIDRVWPTRRFRSRSAFLDEAAQQYAKRLLKASLKRKLKEGYKTKAKENLDLLSELESVNNELPDN